MSIFAKETKSLKVSKNPKVSKVNQDEQTIELSENDFKAVKENIKTSLFPDDSSINQNQAPNISDLEAVKIILYETMLDKNLPSLTNLDIEEIESIENAMTLNKIWKNPLITEKVYIHLKLKRSHTKESNNLLSHVFKLANSTTNAISNEASGLSKFISRR